MECKSQYIIRFNDCDPFNHLNNSRYLDYMLNAREDHLTEFHNMKLSDYYGSGIGWVVSSHEIIFASPASYNEKVTIHSSLIEATPEYLLVEMIMMNEGSSHVKAVLRTKFSCVNLKTQQRENHSAEFMSFAESLVNHEIDFREGLSIRVNNIRIALKKKKINKPAIDSMDSSVKLAEGFKEVSAKPTVEELSALLHPACVLHVQLSSQKGL